MMLTSSDPQIYASVITQSPQKFLSIPEFKAASEEQLETSQLYLDSDFRYQIVKEQNLDSLKPFFTSKDKQFYELRVRDFKPLQKSSLDSILETLETVEHHSLVRAGIPAIAFPYLSLAEFCPTVPELYDAWKNEETGQEFLVISEPESWQLLSDALQNQSISVLQTLSYLDEMAKLWQGLSKVSCGQTLLQVTNIGLDESETLVIRQIFPDEPNNPPELEQLLNFWLQLLPDSKLQETKIVLKLLSLLNTGEVKNIKQLRSTMQTLSQEKQLQSLSVEEKNEDLLLLEAEDELEALSAQFDVDDYGEDLSTRVVSPVEDINDQPTIVLPMDLLSLTDAAYTDIGTRRSHNEDCFASDTRINKQESPQGTILRARGLYLVCDGMGGHAGGEVASAMAVQNISDYFQEHWQEKLPDVEVIKQGILQANQAIYRTNLQKGSSGSQRMGTTLVMVLIEGTKVVLVNVGDSRIYQLTRKSGLEQLTRDHCVAQMEIKRGVNPEIAYQRMDAFQLTQALGPRDDHFVHPDITFMDIKEDTLFILCSDGLCDNNLLENNWQTYLSPLISSKADLNEGLSQLIDLANQVNGHDNITAVLVRVKVQPNLDKQKS
jgi:protein phosphatase